MNPPFHLWFKYNVCINSLCRARARNHVGFPCCYGDGIFIRCVATPETLNEQRGGNSASDEMFLPLLLLDFKSKAGTKDALSMGRYTLLYCWYWNMFLTLGNRYITISKHPFQRKKYNKNCIIFKLFWQVCQCSEIRCCNIGLNKYNNTYLFVWCMRNIGCSLFHDQIT